MNQYTALKQTLKPHLGWHGARLSFLALFLLALLKVKTVNLKELALGFEGRALVESHYKHLQRFFANFKLDYSQIAQIVVHWLNIPQPWVLSIDRTTWEFGSHFHNILTIGIVHEGVAIPILSKILKKKKGNSNSNERMWLIEEMLKIFLSAMNAYISLGVPELWIYSETGLQIYELQAGKYQAVSISPTFPNLPIQQLIAETIEQSNRFGRSPALRTLRKSLQNV